MFPYIPLSWLIQEFLIILVILAIPYLPIAGIALAIAYDNSSWLLLIVPAVILALAG